MSKLDRLCLQVTNEHTQALYLVYQAIINHGAADFLKQLVKSFDFTHTNCTQNKFNHPNIQKKDYTEQK